MSAFPNLVLNHNDNPSLYPNSKGIDKISRRVVSEFISSLFLSFLTACVLYVGYQLSLSILTVGFLLFSSLTYGMIYAAIFYAFSFPNTYGRVDLSQYTHANPLISICIYLTSKIYKSPFYNIYELIIILVSQAVGSISGSFMVIMATPYSFSNLSPTLSLSFQSPPLSQSPITSFHLLEHSTSFMVVLSELISVTLMILTVLSIVFPLFLQSFNKPSPHSTSHEYNCIVLCAVITCTTFVNYTISGGLMNPLLSLGHCLVFNNYHNLLNLWIGGSLSAFLTPFIFYLCKLNHKPLNEYLYNDLF